MRSTPGVLFRARSVIAASTFLTEIIRCASRARLTPSGSLEVAFIDAKTWSASAAAAAVGVCSRFSVLLHWAVWAVTISSWDVRMRPSAALTSVTGIGRAMGLAALPCPAAVICCSYSSCASRLRRAAWSRAWTLRLYRSRLRSERASALGLRCGALIFCCSVRTRLSSSALRLPAALA